MIMQSHNNLQVLEKKPFTNYNSLSGNWIAILET
jgi:hypothetical protein